MSDNILINKDMDLIINVGNNDLYIDFNGKLKSLSKDANFLKRWIVNILYSINDYTVMCKLQRIIARNEETLKINEKAHQQVEAAIATFSSKITSQMHAQFTAKMGFTFDTFINTLKELKNQPLKVQNPHEAKVEAEAARIADDYLKLYERGISDRFDELKRQLITSTNPATISKLVNDLKTLKDSYDNHGKKFNIQSDIHIDLLNTLKQLIDNELEKEPQEKSKQTRINLMTALNQYENVFGLNSSEYENLRKKILQTA